MRLIIRELRLQDYATTWQAMQEFTQTRTENTPDELWLLEHPSVFTLGQAGKEEHVLNPGKIPLLKVDRGGQVTYHGPGQLMAYTLIDLRRKHLTVHQLVHGLENVVIRFLADYGISAAADPKAPGVYIAGKKICSVGLRIRRGCAYHGLALNINVDLAPFTLINPCGYKDLKMTRLLDFAPDATVAGILPAFTRHFCAELGYTTE